MIIVVKQQRSVPKFERCMMKGIWFVWYYATWCGHCRTMEDEWKVFVTKVPKGINVAQVESETIPKFSMDNRPNVMGYPTLKLYNNGNEVTDYDGERTSTEFLKFLNKVVKNPDSKKAHIHPSHLPTLVKVPKDNQLNPKLEESIKDTFKNNNVDLERPVQNQNEQIANIIDRISKSKKNEQPIKINNNIAIDTLLPLNFENIKQKSKTKSRTKSRIENKTKTKSLADIVESKKLSNNNRQKLVKSLRKNNNNKNNNNNTKIVTIKMNDAKSMRGSVPARNSFFAEPKNNKPTPKKKRRRRKRKQQPVV